MEKVGISFTNEKIAKRFKSNFELVNYAIHLAEDRIRAGRDIHEIGNENLVVSVVKDLATGKDILIPIVTVVEKIEAVKVETKADLQDDGVPVERPVKKAKRKIIRKSEEE